ncbi:MAG: tetratricopeptide repeat protein [Ktedonobacteraceae bacterium]
MRIDKRGDSGCIYHICIYALTMLRQVFHLTRQNIVVHSRQNIVARYTLTDGEAECGAGQPAMFWYIFGNAAKDLEDYDHAIRDNQKAIHLEPRFHSKLRRCMAIQRLLEEWDDARIWHASAASGLICTDFPKSNGRVKLTFAN